MSRKHNANRKRKRKRNASFIRVWMLLAEQGACDGLGGAEYLRLRRCWEAEGRPIPIEGWIRARANPPSPQSPVGD